MSETEIRKNYQEPENRNTLNFKDNSPSTSHCRVTVLKANVFENLKEYTPRVEASEKNCSSGKLIRVNSSKGINVTSSRPTSSQKPPREFSATGNSFHSGSESTIKKQETNLMLQMREQLKKANQLYENKMNQELSYQYNYMSIEIDRLKQINKTNQKTLNRQQLEIQSLNEGIRAVDQKTNVRISNLEKELMDFKSYYQRCDQYTLSRINDVDAKMQTLQKLVEESTCPVMKSIACTEVQKAHDILERMTQSFIERSSMLRTQIKDQIYELQIMLGGCNLKVDELDEDVYQMKMIGFRNQAFSQSLKEAVSSNTKLASPGQRSSANSCDIGLRFNAEEVSRQALKKIKSCEVQIELINSMNQINYRQSKERKMDLEQKVEEMGKIISTLDQKIQEDKIWYLQQIKEKEQIMVKANPRVLQLEQRLKASYELQAHLHKEISELSLKIAYLQTKCSKLNEREYSIQTTLAQAFSESVVKEKTKQFEVQKISLNKKIQDLNLKIKEMDHENYLLAQKLSEYQNSKEEVKKLSEEVSFLAKLSQKSQSQSNEFLDQIGSLKQTVAQLQKKNKTIQEEKQELLANKRHISAEDQLYIDELEAEVQKKIEWIEILEAENKNLKVKNQQILEQNKNLQNNLHLYAQTFEKQSVNFRIAIQKLQKEKDFYVSENDYIKKENRSLQQDISMTRSGQSFFGNSDISLRKTFSTQLSSPKSMKKREQISKPKAQRQSRVVNISKIIQDLKLPLPILCEIDEKGYLKMESSKSEILDENGNLLRLGEQQLEQAISLGLILL